MLLGLDEYCRKEFQRWNETKCDASKKIGGKMIPQMRGEEIISENFDKKIFSTTNQKIPANFSVADKQKYTALYQNAIKTKIIPAYKEWEIF